MGTEDKSTYERKASKEMAKEEGAGHAEMSRVRGASGGSMPSAKQPHDHECVHDAYKSTKAEGLVSSHDEHRSDSHHHTMDEFEHKGMPHHVNKP